MERLSELIDLATRGRFGEAADLLETHLLERAEESHPTDPATVWGIAHACQEKGDYERALYYYCRLLSMEAPELIKDLAHDGCRETTAALRQAER